MSRAESKAPPASTPALPSQAVRTTISLLLFVHFFMLGGALLGNLSVTSNLMRKLVRVPGIHEYLSLLHLDTAFQYTLADERDHRVMVVLDVPADIKSPAAANQEEAANRLSPAQIAEHKSYALMPESAGPGIRRRRYLKLGQLLSQANEDSTLETYLAVALANGLLKEQEHPLPEKADPAFQNHIVCLEFAPQPLDIAQVPDAQRGLTAPRWQASAFDGIVYPSGDKWGVTSRVARSEASGSSPRRPVLPPQGKSAPASNGQTQPAVAPTGSAGTPLQPQQSGS